MKIYSNKFENVILWENEILEGKTLNIDATDTNINALYQDLLAAETEGVSETDEDYEQTLSICKQIAWEKTWESKSEIDGCYVWDQS